MYEGVCRVCFQPECPQSSGGNRPASGAFPSPIRPIPGRATYMGYGDWAMHPDEAVFVLHRGYGFVSGLRHNVTFMGNWPTFTLVHIVGWDQPR